MSGSALTDDDKKLFEGLLTQSMNSMYGLACHLTLNEQEARDLVQEASLRAWRFFDKFEQGTNFKSWILTILRNLFINEYRKRKSGLQRVEVENLENIAGDVRIDTRADQDEAFGELLQKHVESLPEEMRAVIGLYYAEGLSYKDIAGIMECPVGTVMSRLFQAKQVLRKKLSVKVHKT